MVEPVTIIVAITTIISLFSSGINWIRKNMDTQSPLPASLSVTTQMYPPAILLSSINEDIPSIF
jgi:hypothetical protein